MENWSDQPINNFTIKFYLDTNILSFLIDETFIGLTNSIRLLQESDFATLVSSSFGIFELAGIRKREHYLRKVIDGQNKTNISSLLKYKDDFDAPEVDFDSVKHLIKQDVLDDIQKINTDWDIDYKANTLHNGLFDPTIELCLSSKISKEDSLMLISSIFPDESKIEPYVFLLTKDEQFAKAFQTNDLNPIFGQFSLNPPHITSIRNIKQSGQSKINLVDPNDTFKIPAFWNNKLIELIIDKNKSLFLGKTFSPDGNNFPASCIAFKLIPNKVLNPNIYITIISKNLNFIYYSKHAIQEFMNNGVIIQNDFIKATKTNISFLLNDELGNPLAVDIVQQLRDECFVFIHPDSIP